MRRQTRKRSTRRRGLQHVGDVLSSILTDLEIDQHNSQTTEPDEPKAVPAIATAMPSPPNDQATFAFYQTVEM